MIELHLSIGSSLVIATARVTESEKKADVVVLEVFHHVGLLVNGPPGTAELPFI